MSNGDTLLNRHSLLQRIESVRLFSETDAWGLFRLAALAEAGGWTLLIIGILFRHFKLPGHAIAVPIAGQIHGMVFLTYFAVLIATYSSLGWSRKKFLFGLLLGVPPYGTLVFEQWAIRVRQAKFSRTHFRTIVLVAALQA